MPKFLRMSRRQLTIRMLVVTLGIAAIVYYEKVFAPRYDDQVKEEFKRLVEEAEHEATMSDLAIRAMNGDDEAANEYLARLAESHG